jgi:hypothetical protein
MTAAHKTCSTCRETKSAEAFYRSGNAPDGLAYDCKDCAIAAIAEWRERNPKRYRASVARRNAKPINVAARNAYSRRRYREQRAAALAHYSDTTPPSCACCRTAYPEFLALDHIDGGGSAHRREVGANRIYSWLAKHGYPEGFRVLCHNCNTGPRDPRLLPPRPGYTSPGNTAQRTP